MQSLSKKTQYTLRALYALARAHGKGPQLISDLADREHIPHSFLESILLQLKGEGLVESKKGKGGGYQLAKDPRRVMIGSIIRITEGPLAPLPCASETAYRKCDECADATNCGTRVVMRQVRDAMAAILDNTSLSQVCERMEEAERRVRENRSAPNT